jgi:hypothetical protein
MDVDTLENLLLNNVLDVRFVRRIPIPGKAPTRRMLCTKSYDLLNTVNGKVVLNYKPPKTGKQFSERSEGAVVVWDILMQDYRVVSAEHVQVINKIPADDSFWEYFNKNIYVLNTEQKITFMDS